jgi:uncharacterized damage-inducible protein DinB
MSDIRSIRSELHRSLHGPAWHGPALLEVLEDVTGAEAAERPLAGAHSIAELVLHCLAWTEEVGRRLGGAGAVLPARGDWPEASPLDDERWTALRGELRTAGERLDRVLESMPPERLRERVAGPPSDPPLGSGIRFDVMLHGLAQHNAYHGGQIALLKRALRAGGPGIRPAVPAAPV